MGEELLRTDVRYALRTYVALEGQLRTDLRCALRTYCVLATAYLLVPRPGTTGCQPCAVLRAQYVRSAQCPSVRSRRSVRSPCPPHAVNRGPERHYYAQALAPTFGSVYPYIRIYG